MDLLADEQLEISKGHCDIVWIAIFAFLPSYKGSIFFLSLPVRYQSLFI